jgi:dTMP kinase
MPGTRDNFFLVIEGLDGSGKTTIARRLARTLRLLGSDVFLTFEPHDASSAGLYIRQVLTKKIKNVPPKTLALAFALNRADHSQQMIEPFLDGGKRRIVVCDRYYLSSLVYQSTPDLPMEQVYAFNEGVRRPDLTLFLEASANTCYERMRTRAAVSDQKQDRELFEENLESTRAVYEQGIAFLRARGEVIDRINVDSAPIEEIIDQIVSELSEHGVDWIEPQRSPDIVEETLDAFSLRGDLQTEEAISRFVGQVVEQWQAEPPEKSTDSALRQQLQGAVSTAVRALPVNELGLIFLGYIQRSQYTLGDKLPWTDLCCYQLAFTLPMGVTQRGTAIILPTPYNLDMITNKIISGEKLADVSDFMLVLDPGHSRQADTYPREPVVLQGATSLSPSVHIFGREDIAGFLLDDVISALGKAGSSLDKEDDQSTQMTDSLLSAS